MRPRFRRRRGAARPESSLLFLVVALLVTLSTYSSTEVQATDDASSSSYSKPLRPLTKKECESLVSLCDTDADVADQCAMSCEMRRRRLRQEELREYYRSEEEEDEAQGNSAAEEAVVSEDDDEDEDDGDEDDVDEDEDEYEDEDDDDDDDAVYYEDDDDEAQDYDFSDVDVSSIKSFYDLQAKDIDGNVVSFDGFRGGVTIVVNVASYCGYTDDHYDGLIQLHKSYARTGRFHILAFPCNQFGHQEPDGPDDIKEFVRDKGVEFRIMEKIRVNGPKTHPVYRYLKKASGGDNDNDGDDDDLFIDWNFGTYFLVSPDGRTVTSRSGVEPLDLRGDVLELLDQEQQEL